MQAVKLGKIDSLPRMLALASEAGSRGGLPPSAAYLHRIEGEWELRAEPQQLSTKEKRQKFKQALLELIRQSAEPGGKEDKGPREGGAEALRSVTAPDGRLVPLTVQRLAQMCETLPRRHEPGPAAHARDKDDKGFSKKDHDRFHSILQRLIVGRATTEEVKEAADLLTTQRGLADSAAAALQEHLSAVRADGQDIFWMQFGFAVALLPEDVLDRIELTVQEVAHLQTLYRQGFAQPPREGRNAAHQRLREKFFSPSRQWSMLGPRVRSIEKTSERLAQLARTRQAEGPSRPAAPAGPRRPGGVCGQYLAGLWNELQQGAQQQGEGPDDVARARLSLRHMLHVALNPVGQREVALAAHRFLAAIPLLHDAPELAHVAVDMLEAEADRIQHGFDHKAPLWGGGEPEQYQNLSPYGLLLVPVDAWKDVYLPRRVVENIAFWHEKAKPGETPARKALLEGVQGNLDLMKKDFPDLHFDPAAVIATLRRNADDFEKFLHTELAHDPELFDIDRVILIDVARQLGWLDHACGPAGGDAPLAARAAAGGNRPSSSSQAGRHVPAPMDSRAAALPQDPPAQPVAAAGERIADGLQALQLVEDPPAPRTPSVPAQGDEKRRQGAPARDLKNVVSPAPLMPNDNHGVAPPVRPKRATPHHDAGRAKWRKKEQRDVYGRIGHLDRHREAIRALRELWRGR